MGRATLTALVVGDPFRRSMNRRPVYAHRQCKQAAGHHIASCARGRSDRPCRPWCVSLHLHAQLDRQASRAPKCWALASSFSLSRDPLQWTLTKECPDEMADASDVDVGTDPPSPTPQPMTKCRSRQGVESGVQVHGPVTRCSGAG